MEYLKGNTIPDVDTLSRLEFGNENVQNHENTKDNTTLDGNRHFALKSTQNSNKARLPY